MFLWNAFCFLSLSAGCSLRERQSQWSEVRNPGQNVETSPPRFRVISESEGHSSTFGMQVPQTTSPGFHTTTNYFLILCAKRAGGAGRVCVCVGHSPGMRMRVLWLEWCAPSHTVLLLSLLPRDNSGTRASPKSTLLRAQTLDWTAPIRTRRGELSGDALVSLVTPECKLPCVPESAFCSAREHLLVSLEMKVLVPGQRAVSRCATTSRTTAAGGGYFRPTCIISWEFPTAPTYEWLWNKRHP